MEALQEIDVTRLPIRGRPERELALRQQPAIWRQRRGERDVPLRGACLADADVAIRGREINFELLWLGRCDPVGDETRWAERLDLHDRGRRGEDPPERS